MLAKRIIRSRLRILSGAVLDLGTKTHPQNFASKTYIVPKPREIREAPNYLITIGFQCTNQINLCMSV